MLNIVFDLDGTLLESNEFDGELYIQAVREILGGEVHIHEDWNLYAHVTDSGILAQILEENKIPNPEVVSEQVRRLFGELIAGYLAHTKISPKKSALEMLATLSASKDCQCGIATGGWGHTAIMKLESAGFDFSGIPLCTSDDHHVRTEIMRLCSKKMSADSECVVYVGDAPWDIVASTELGWGFVGVGERLEGVAEIWIADFADPFWKYAPNKALQRTSR